MNTAVQKLARCAIYTRKSTEHNLDLAFTSLELFEAHAVSFVSVTQSLQYHIQYGKAHAQ